MSKSLTLSASALSLIAAQQEANRTGGACSTLAISKVFSTPEVDARLIIEQELGAECIPLDERVCNTKLKEQTSDKEDGPNSYNRHGQLVILASSFMTFMIFYQ